MDWTKPGKPFGIACFLSADPLNPEGDGDSIQFADTLDAATARIEVLLKAGRFNYCVLWRDLGNEWSWIDEFRADPPIKPKPPKKRKNR